RSLSLNELVQTTLHITMEFAGADRGLWIVPDIDGLRVEGEATHLREAGFEDRSGSEVRDVSYAESPARYALATHHAVVVDGDTATDTFEDCYLQTLQDFSLLCCPVRGAKEVIGLLYLENRHMNGLFDASRLEVLQVLVTQAAVAYENARLYEERVERERELLQMKESLEAISEKRAELLSAEVVHRRQAENEVLRKEQYFETIFETVQEGILALNREGIVTRSNRAARELLDLSRDNLAEQSLHDILPQAFLQLQHSIPQHAASGASSDEFELHLHQADGPRVLKAYITPLKPPDSDDGEWVIVLRDITRLAMLEREAGERRSLGSLIGSSRAMQEIYRFIEDLGETPTTVLLTGESGTGKGMIATALHQESVRADQPFVSLNCAALNDEMLSSELFGHVKGAFTGAVKDRAGRFELAEGGTLFLDEIGDISPQMQAALLRVLEKGEYERLGESRTRKADVRIIAATNRDLKEKMAEGSFREDLYYRLNVVSIHVPPLRERKEDIPLLVNHFLNLLSTKLQKQVTGITSEAMELLMSYCWVGNIRELKNLLERAVIMCRADRLDVNHFPDVLLSASPECVENRQGEPLDTQKTAAPTATQTTEAPHAPKNPVPPRRRRRLTRDLVSATLDETGWNVSETARRLDVTRQYIHRLIKKFDLHDAAP
ncbi:GAF domain-containing protein, partial [bacterium]|nr:GAF domain-containing protein [bacterium]